MERHSLWKKGECGKWTKELAPFRRSGEDDFTFCLFTRRDQWAWFLGRQRVERTNRTDVEENLAIDIAPDNCKKE